MPQIPSSYIVLPELTAKLKALADAEEYDELMMALCAQAIPVKPEYPYSGYVLSVLSEYLHEQKLELPISPKWLGEDVFEETEVAWLLCVEHAQAAALSEQLTKRLTSEDEMRRYYEAFNGETSPESGKMMAEGISYLQNGLRQLNMPGQWLIVVLG